MLIAKASSGFLTPKKPVCMQLVKFWKLFIDIQYFLLCSPFRVKIIATGDSSWLAIASTWLPQKFLCGTITLLGFLFHFNKLRNTFPINEKDPTMYLFLSFRISIMVSVLACGRLYWFNQAKLLAIFNFLFAKHHILPESKTPLVKIIFQNKMGKAFYYVLIFLTSFMVTLYWAIDNWSAEFQTGQQTFSLGNNTSESVNILVEVITGLGYVWVYQVAFYQELFTVLIVIIVWLPVKGFAEQLVRNQVGEISRKYVDSDIFHLTATKLSLPARLYWCQVQEQYYAIKELAMMVNCVFGWMKFCFVLESVLYYSARLDEMFLKNGNFRWADIPANCYLLITTGIGLVLSADVCKQVIVF